MGRRTATTRDTLKTKAAQLFLCICLGELPLKISEGWLTGWREQYGVKQYKLQGEVESAPTDEAQQQMQELEQRLPGK